MQIPFVFSFQNPLRLEIENMAGEPIKFDSSELRKLVVAIGATWLVCYIGYKTVNVIERKFSGSAGSAGSGKWKLHLWIWNN